MNCPLCALFRIDFECRSTRDHDPLVPLVAAAYLGWTKGSDGFKKDLCVHHRQRYMSLLVRAGLSLDAAMKEAG